MEIGVDDLTRGSFFDLEAQGIKNWSNGGFSEEIGERSAPSTETRVRDDARVFGAEGRDENLVTSRNNFEIASPTAFRFPRPYVQACAKASLGVLKRSHGRHIAQFKALMCGSWSCPNCRKVLAARTLDRLRSALMVREGSKLALLTLTVDPSQFGARVVGRAIWEGGRETNLWSEPNSEQFRACAAAMSREFKKLLDRLNFQARARGLDKFGYFRVIELHRNGWPHYHVVLEHPSISPGDLQAQLQGWDLGLIDARPVTVDDAVAELAPYLMSTEKGKRSKAYQFAATALPKNFRLYTASQGFLSGPESAQDEQVEVQHTVVLRGHFSSFKETLEAFQAESVAWVCPPPSDGPHKPPGAVQGEGDGAVVLYTELVTQPGTSAPPVWFLDPRASVEHSEHVKGDLSLDMPQER